MKNNGYLFRSLMAMAAITFVIGSCKHSDPSPSNSSAPQLDASTSKTTLTTINTSVSAAISDANNQPGNAAIRTLNNISSATSSNLIPINSINLRSSGPGIVNTGLLGFVSGLGKIALNVTNVTNGNLRIAPDFNASKGIWKYNDTINDFVKTGAASDIVIEFPDSINYVNKTGVNNCIYTIQQLQTQIVNIGSIAGLSFTDTLITQLTANLYINNNKAFDLTYSATYSSNYQPSKVNYNLNVGNYSYSVSLLLALPTETITESLQKSGTTVYSIDYNANFQGDTTISSTLQAGDIKVSGSYDFKKLYAYVIASYNPASIKQTATDSVLPYPYYTGTVSQVSTGAKIGDIEMLRSKVSTGSAPYTYTYFTYTSVVVYKDGTYDNISTVLSSVWNYLSSLFGRI